MDGFSPRLAPALCLGISLLAPGVSSQETAPGEVILHAKVRDFKEMNETSPDNTHPHFNTYNACSALESGAPTVRDALAEDDSEDGGLLPGDNRGPRLRDDMPDPLSRCYAPADRFSDWFQDKGPDVNRAFRLDLRFTRDPATGLYAYRNTSFFPLDAGSPLAKFDPADPDPFGHLQAGELDGKDLSLHNYGFTMEFHTRVVYEAGQGHRMEFQGDDDIWVFLDGRKIVDLGGVHQTQMASVDMDSIAGALGLEDGVDYPLDVFFAERHTASSSFQIAANLHIPSASIGPRLAKAPRGAFQAPEGARFDVFDRAGRLIRTLRAEAGQTLERLWDGRDAGGRIAAPGMYFYRVQAGPGGPVLTGRIVMNGGRG